MKKQYAISTALAWVGLLLAPPLLAFGHHHNPDPGGGKSAGNNSISGMVNATIVLTSACIINGAVADGNSGSAQFGSLDFGSQTTLFDQADSTVVGGGGGSGISIQCSPGSGSASLSFLKGLNDGKSAGGHLHAMTDGANDAVPYDLYSDAGRSTVIKNGDSLTLKADGSTQTVNVYGRAYGAVGLPAGIYTDTVYVTLSF